jgi:hypothetical protein
LWRRIGHPPWKVGLLLSLSLSSLSLLEGATYLLDFEEAPYLLLLFSSLLTLLGIAIKLCPRKLHGHGRALLHRYLGLLPFGDPLLRHNSPSLVLRCSAIVLRPCTEAFS